MKIIKIEISNYKSIKNPIEVKFTDGLPTVLIGKNGCGKTNILDVLYAMFDGNEVGYYGIFKPIIKTYVSVSKDEFGKIFPSEKYNADKCIIAAVSHDGHRIDSFESDYIVPLIKKEIADINSIAEQLKKTVSEYYAVLNGIVYDEHELTASDVAVPTQKTTNLAGLKRDVEWLLSNVNKIVNGITEATSHGGNLFVSSYFPYMTFENCRNYRFELKYNFVAFSEFEKKYISINEESLKREIDSINGTTKELCDKITDYMHTIDARAKILSDATYSDDFPLTDAKYYMFFREIINTVQHKCAFLRSENSGVIFKKDENDWYRHINDKSELILKTYLTVVYNGGDKEKLIHDIEYNKKEFSLPEGARAGLQEYLNDHRPEFEKDMYDSVSVKETENGFSIILLEKTGEEIPLEQTSLGRRWYFTYYFMKSVLKKGDIFIIDEPGTALHPTAQKEILKELEDLEKGGIKVIYSTHSPYLIPDDWKCVQMVSMGENGTECQSVSSGNELSKYIREIAGNDIFNLQTIVEMFNKGNTEKIANECYNAIIKKYKKVEIAASEINLTEEALKSWRKKADSKKFRCPKLENILLIAYKTETNIYDLLR